MVEVEEGSFESRDGVTGEGEGRVDCIGRLE